MIRYSCGRTGPFSFTLKNENLKMKFRMLMVAAVAAMLVIPAVADDAKKERKKKGSKGARTAAMQMMKQLEVVGLTDEQTTKLKELGATADEAMEALRNEAGLTKELVKKRTDAQKELKGSGKKGKELAAAVNEKAGLTEQQAAAFASLNAARMKFHKEVVGMLTDEQKAKLPEKMMRMMKSGKGKKGKKKKNKDDA